MKLLFCCIASVSAAGWNQDFSHRGSAYHNGLRPVSEAAWLSTDPTRNTAGGKVHLLPTDNTLIGPTTNLAWQKHKHTNTHASKQVAVSGGCSHVTCSVKKHACHKYNTDASTWAPENGVGTYEWDGNDNMPFAPATQVSHKFDADECDGTLHYSVVVQHHRDENVCATTGHHCGLGVITGSDECECHQKGVLPDCPTGYERNGEGKCVDLDECAPNNGAGPCQNNGICTDSTDDSSIAIGQHQCVCPQGWQGMNCEQDTNECALNNGAGPCQNGASCRESNSYPAIGIGTYQCVCSAGWYGTNCEIDVNECAANNGFGPCHADNALRCTESNTDSNIAINDYQCTCGPGWMGKDCSVPKPCTVAAPVNNVQVAGTIDCRNGAAATGTTGNCGCNCGTDGIYANGFTNESPASTICNDCAEGKGKVHGQGNSPDRCVACQYPNINAVITHSAACAAQQCPAGYGVTSDQGNWDATGDNNNNCELCGTGYDSPEGSGQCQALACTIGPNGPGTINCQNGGVPRGYTGTCTCDCAGTGFTDAECTTSLFSMPTTTITNCGKTHGDQGPSQSQCQIAYANTGSSFLTGVTMDPSYPGIQKFTVPQAGTGTYRIKAYGPGGGQRWLNEIYGAGAIVQGYVQLTGGDTLWVLVGQKSDYYKNGRNAGAPYSSWYKTYWTGGSGGTFVAKGSSLSDSTPLIVAGGGSGHRSSNEKDDRNSAEGHGAGQGTMDGWCNTYAQDAGTHSGSWNTAKVGSDTVATSNNNLKLGFGHGGKGGYGGQGGNSGAWGSPSNSLTSKSHTAGGGAGFYGDGRRSLDSRGGTTPVSAKSFINGGRGGLFKPGYTTYSGGNWINGGFGGGGSGSWGDTGGAGGFSGGGGDPNSGFGGGGGSFCAPGTNGSPTDAANGCSCTWGSGTWTSSDTYINGAGNDHLGKVEIQFCRNGVCTD